MFHLAFSFPDTESVFITKQAIMCRLDCSTSSILSLASHIVNNFTALIPPNLSSYPTGSSSSEDACSESNYHPYFELWTSYILTCYLKGHAVLFNSVTYVEVSLPSEYKEPLQENSADLYLNRKVQLANLSAEARISFIFDIPLIHKEEKIAIFNNNAPYRQEDLFVPRINDPAIFIGNLFNNQEWSVFNIAKGEVPSIEEIMVFDGIVLTGSEYSVLDVHPHTSAMIQNPVQAYRKKENLKILGVCYGHQLISKYFNAVLMKKSQTKGLQQVKFVTTILKKHIFLSPIEEGSCLLSQFHEDYVETIPNGFDLVGQSKSCKVQMLLSNDLRILTTQFHAEYSSKFTQAYVRRSSYYLKKFNESFYYSKSSNQIEDKHIEDCSRLIRVFVQFLAQQEQLK